MTRSIRFRRAIILAAVSVLISAVAWSDENSSIAATEELEIPLSRIVLSEAAAIAPEGGRNPTVAVDPKSGTVYLAWAQEVADSASNAAADDAKPADPRLQAMLVHSDDGGRRFGDPVPVHSSEENVRSYTASPTRVEVGPGGEVYVLYSRKAPNFTLPGGIVEEVNQLRLARSNDGGKSFGESVDIAAESVEGVQGSPGMINLFVAANGDLYASWLDYRETFDYLAAHKKEPPKGTELATQLRVARSTDGGRSFAASTLVTKPVCGCCGTKVAQGTSGPVYASTRAAWPELKGSVDAVRDIIVSASADLGAKWSEPVKVHDDRFKISGCPDVAPGLSVDSKGRLHAAWYTGTEQHPGVFYAVSADNGKSFSEPIELLGDEWVPYADVKLALDAEDHAWVAFEDRRGDSDLIRLVRIDPNGQVTRAEPWPGTIPDVATRGDSAIVAWGGLALEDDDHGGRVFARVARIEPGS
jgi:hypothetical protein